MRENGQKCIMFSVQSIHSVVSDSLQPHEPQHARSPCPSLTPRVYSNPCPLSQGCHPTISSSVIPFSSCPQLSPASGSFPVSRLLASGSQSIYKCHQDFLGESLGCSLPHKASLCRLWQEYQENVQPGSPCRLRVGFLVGGDFH